MKFLRISRWFLAALLPTMGGCSLIGGGTDGASSIANMPVAVSSLSENDQISELQSQLASEKFRAKRAERNAQRASAEADWLAKSALNEPELRERNAEMELEIEQLRAENQRIRVLEANLKDLAAENDQLSRALRGDWSEAPQSKAPETAAAPRSLIDETPAPSLIEETSAASAVASAVASPASGVEQRPSAALSRSANYAAGSYAVHLASYRTKEETLDGWLRLRLNYPGLLRNLSGRFPFLI